MLRIFLSNSQISYPIDSVMFGQEDNLSFFVLRSSDNTDINIVVPYNLPVKNDYLSNNFTCTPFITPSFYKENDIFEVHHIDVKVGRIGWIFPIQSLVSNEHTLAEDIHFLKYAFVTYETLLKGELFQEDLLVNVSEIDGKLRLDEIFPSNLIVLSLSNEKTTLSDGFDIINYLHSFYTYKYFICQSITEVEALEKHSLQAEFSKIRISELSVDLQKEVFITALYKDHLKAKNHPLVQFHLLYQLIELLINRVYDCEMKKIIDLTQDKQKNAHDIGAEIKAITAEEFRIKKMVANYCSGKTIKGTNLIQSSNALLKHVSKEKKTFTEAFYQVRNLSVHNYRKITEIDIGFNLLDAINKDFEVVLSDLLSFYKEPEYLPPSEENLPLAWLIYNSLIELN